MKSGFRRAAPKPRLFCFLGRVLSRRDMLAVANPYLGPCPSLQTDWTPLKNRFDPFEHWSAKGRPTDEAVWQFESFVAW